MKLWIARDKSMAKIGVKEEQLFLYSTKPIKKKEYDVEFWGIADINDGEAIKIDSKLFPEVTFENSPQEVELKLLKK